MTRATLFRLILALKMLANGFSEIFYFLLPSNMKHGGWNNPVLFWLGRKAMKMLARSIDATYAVVAAGSMGGPKIGDTINVRKPYRFCR